MPLPNPNMVFVPLDVLTAEEMNQIVENIEYVDRNVAVTGSSIKVGDRMIQWGTAMVPNIQTGQQGNTDIVFPQAYPATPTVFTTVISWVAGSPVVIAAATTKTGFKAVAYQNHGNTQSITFNWMAIGQKQ